MLNKEIVIRLFQSLYRIRRVEEEIARVYSNDVIKSPVHLSIGQEFVSVGICDILLKEDVVFGTYRGHALYLAKGGNLNAMMAELYGKMTGCCQGKGGSMHLIDLTVNMMGTSAIAASSIPEAVGYSLGIQYQRGHQIVVCFLGDGATNEGGFHESLNFAALKALPILFVCENNDYAIHSRLAARSAQQELHVFAKANCIPAYTSNDGDIFTLRNLARVLTEEIRNGGGPRFIEVSTYRWMEHVGPGIDWDLGYRSREEATRWVKYDQLEHLGKMLPHDKQSEVKREIEDEIAAAMTFAEESSFPGEEEYYKHVYR